MSADEGEICMHHGESVCTREHQVDPRYALSSRLRAFIMKELIERFTQVVLRSHQKEHCHT